ncbi:MAG: Do family serine endopeptidase [Hyphomicrobiales bacterium]|nr:Do family serine endopeptidase [Hyphomicrobiales bacterium]
MANGRRPKPLAAWRALLAAAFMAAAGLPQTLSDATARERAAPTTRESIQLSFAPIVKTAAPAVVNVYVSARPAANAPLANDPFFRHFFRQEPNRAPRAQNSLGSGVIVSADGLIVTNNHVIQGGDAANVTVALADNREFEAKVILRDPRTDLAVLRIQDADGDFPHLRFGDSDALEVGDLVLAIGNPFGVGQTVTSGIVSALARTRIGVTDYQFFIQTDAAINPGNSGGALVDMNGDLIGVNTAIFTRSGGSQGVGFAIPSNMVKLIADSAMSGARVRRPWLGAKLEPVTPDIARALGLERAAGALVGSVAPTGPAERAGLRPGDVLLQVDGREVTDPQTFYYYFTTKGLEGSVKVEALQPVGRRRQLAIALTPPPETTPRDERTLSGPHPFSGARIANLSPAVAEELSADAFEGVAVIETEAYSTARRVGLQPGDIIVSVNGKTVGAVAEVQRAVTQPARVWRLVIRRGGREIRTVVRS